MDAMSSTTPDRRARILAAADSLFAGRSFGEVRMEDIARGADVGKVTIYRYFPTKAALYLALLDRARLAYFGPRPTWLAALDRAEGLRDTCRFLLGLLAEGAARGEWEVGDLDVAARALLGGLRCQLLYPLAGITPEHLAARLVQAL